MGYIFDFNDTNAHLTWCEQAGQQYDFQLQTALMMKMLSPLADRSILDIGCGWGRCAPAFMAHGLQVTGVDPSPYMLDMALDRFGTRLELHRAFGEGLPFEDNSFNYSVFMTSLEFMDRPAKAIEEACRVTRDKVFIGVLNKFAPLNIHRRIKGFFCHNTLSHGRFFGIGELKKIIFAIMGPVPCLLEHHPAVSLYPESPGSLDGKICPGAKISMGHHDRHDHHSGSPLSYPAPVTENFQKTALWPSDRICPGNHYGET